jgi:hypothetical protein
MSVSPRNPVQVKSSLTYRFYEPIVLLLSLNEAYLHNRPAKAPDLSLDVGQSHERSFHCFVNKLGQLCDSERGGNTVTAFVVLQFPDHIQYRFTSNQRKDEDLDHARTFITHILETLCLMDRDDMPSHILQKALSFTRPRVAGYVKQLKIHAVTCISACTKEGTEDCRCES